MVFPLSAIDILNALAPRGGCRLASDIAYGRGPRGTLDVYAPDRVGAPAPVVVFFYGGGWVSGDKAIYRFLGATLARRGFVVVIPDYRVFPEVRFPGFVEDGARVIAWAHGHVAEYGGDPRRIVLMGHSAGAYIAAMLNFDRQWLAALGLDLRGMVRGLIGLAGAYDFLPLRSATLKAIFGPEDQLAQTQPINFVDGTAAPAFLATGRNDRRVDPGNVSRLTKRIRDAGGSATSRFYDNVGHRTLIGAFAMPLRPLAPVLRDTVRFIADVTGAELSAQPPWRRRGDNRRFGRCPS
jgi:acetyl esterase/lipase